MEFRQRSNASTRVATLVILTMGFVLLTVNMEAQQYLYNFTDLAVGNGPAGVIFGDFNHDGRTDLVVTNFSDNTVSVMLGASGGNFVPKVNYATGASPSALVGADFRHDGKIDLAVANENAGTVSVLLGNGNGTFQAHVDYSVGSDPIGVVAADFNADGKLDIAVANQNDSTISILLGNGDGTFQSQTVVAVGMLPTSLGSGDFNGDHKVDLITSSVGSGVVSVLLSTGDGSFTRVDSPSGLFSPDTSMLAVGDFNKDGKLDVVVSSNTKQQLFLFPGEGNGSFQNALAIPSAPFDPTQALVAGDFNHDGKLDLASVALDALSGIVVWLGNGDGTFHKPVVSPSGPLTSLAVADINGDGHLDLAATSQITNSVGFFLGKGDGTFAMPRIVSLSQTVYGPNSTVAADFNGDGKLDLAVAETNFPNGQISVVLGNGHGGFSKPLTSPLASAAINNQDKMLAGDFNGDGKSDLIIMDDYGTGFQVLLGNGDGTFQAAVDTKLNTTFSFSIGDFNNDGKTDLVVTTFVNGQTKVSIYLSNGDGTFHLGAQYTESYGGIAVGDVNKDSKPDLIFTSFGQPLLVMLGNGDGTFQNPIVGPSAIYSGATVIRDFNADGKPDIAVGTYTGIAFLEGNGDGTFRSPVYSDSTIQFCCQMVAGDINGDGKLDLVNVTNQYVAAYAMLGNGDGTFRPAIAYSANGQLYSGNLVVDDFNSDGIADIGFIFKNVYSGVTMTTLNLSVPEIDLFPTSLSFGFEKVGTTSLPRNIQMTNQGNANLLVNIVASGDFLEQNNCGRKLGIGKSCTIQVSFKPAATGVRTGLITLTDNAIGNPQQISVTGTGQ